MLQEKHLIINKKINRIIKFHKHILLLDMKGFYV